MKIKLVVGLGNPGTQYDHTRHNAGRWLVESFIGQLDLALKPEKKFQGLHGKTESNQNTCHFLIPTTFMNHSGQALRTICSYYKIESQALLVAHDDLDLDPGTIKLKFAGGHGGHNGLRNIIEQLGTNSFHRIRVGIGHPGDKTRVLNYVLGNPCVSEATAIQTAINKAIDVLPIIIQGDFQKAMYLLHSAEPNNL